jgi:hypothetical protein
MIFGTARCRSLCVKGAGFDFPPLLHHAADYASNTGSGTNQLMTAIVADAIAVAKLPAILSNANAKTSTKQR